VVRFDRRVLTVNFNGEQFLTRESQPLAIDYYIKWRIRDASQYYQSTGGDEQRAAGLVGDKIQDGIKNAIARRTLKDIVISDRQEVTGEFSADAGKSMAGMGIELVDVRLQRIDLQEEVAASVYESMKRTFEGIARSERGEGEKEKNIVMAEADRKRTELVAKALADAQRIRGEGDRHRRRIYAQAVQPQSRVLCVLAQPAGRTAPRSARGRRAGDLTGQRVLPLPAESIPKR
jgi:membrane protease subunit HflC